MRCCQLLRKGRFLVAEPFFEPGDPITVANGKKYMGDAGQLALLAVGGSGKVGHLIELLGDVHDLRAVMRGLLAERGAFGETPAPGRTLEEPSQDVVNQLASFDDEVPYVDEREDLRHQLCVTIDPPDAKDHDDALGLEELEDGSVALWVHIADVSAYVPAGSPLDEHAYERGCSVYVPGIVAPMLPHQLSSDLCSLRPGVDRGCLSVRLQLDEDAEVTQVRFARTLIRSARRLTYPQVDELFEEGTSIDSTIDAMLRRLDAITSYLRGSRMKRGALDVNSMDTNVTLDEMGRPMHADVEPETKSHRLVEECMLLANNAVGERLEQSQREAIHRLHPEPDPESIDALLTKLDRLEVPTPPAPKEMTPRQAAETAAQTARAVTRYTEQSGRGRNAFPSLILRSLQQAFYSAQAGRHSGLATERYVHFTSPIRRYPDLVNHRSLLQLIGATVGDVAAHPVAEAAAQASERERLAIKIERTGDKIALSHLVFDLYCDDAHAVYDGEVVGMINAGIFVRFADTFEGFVPARTLGSGERHEMAEDGLSMRGTASGERIRLGDTIRVRIDKVDRASGKVDLRRIPGSS
jgi:ribonuclease R